MSTFNTSTRKDDLSMKLRTQNMKYTRTQTKKLEEDSRKMEERLNELKTAMSREKEERERHGGGFWDRGQMNTGSLTNYASEVLKSKPQIVPKEGKKKKIKVLQDEPLDLPQRSSQPGTMKYIAQRKITSGPSPREKQKGPKCGQCEERTATLSCVQCSEMYCAGCFAAFHLKGALKKHRSVPISASGPRVCMSPRPSVDAQSPRGSQASGSTALYEMQPPVNGSEASGPPSALSTPRNSEPSLLQGDYDESQSAASFQEALMAWRQGDSASPPDVSARKPRPIASPVKSPIMSVDCSTGTTEQAKVPDIKFTASLSYAEKLMLKKHRRTELAEVPTPRLQGQSDNHHLHHHPHHHPEGSGNQMDSQYSSRKGNRNEMYSEEESGVYRDVSFVGDEDRVDFHALFEAVTGMESSSPVRSIPETSHLKAIPSDAPILSSSSTYFISEVSPFESWEMEHQNNKRPVNSSTFVLNQSEKDKTLPFNSSSQRKLDAVTELYSTSTMSTPPTDNEKENYQREANLSARSRRAHNARIGSASSVKEVVEKDKVEGKDNEEQLRMESTNKTRPKSVRAKSAKSRPVSRAQSRAQSRAASRMGVEEGFLTKAPSQALSQIAHMSQDKEYVYQSPMEGFFLVGVDGGLGGSTQENSQTQARPKSRGQALKSARGEREAIKVSNRLYQMAPRSWRPDSSLGETVPMEDIQVPEVDPEMVLSYSYSGQLSGRATEWRPSSSQSGFFMPGDDLGLTTDGEKTESWIPSPSSLSQREVDAKRISKDNSTPTPNPIAPRRKSANRRSNATTPVSHSHDLHTSTDMPTSKFESAGYDEFTTPRARSDFEIPTGQNHSPSSSSSNQTSQSGAVQVKTGVPGVTGQSRSQSRISSSKGGNRLAVDILPSKSDLIPSHKPSRSQQQLERVSSSRQGSQDSMVAASHRGSRSREGSHLSSKNSNLVRHHSDVDQTQRPVSSTNLSGGPRQRTRHEDRRPNSSTGGKEAINNTKSLSYSVDVESANDTVVADMLADRVHTDVWMMGNENEGDGQKQSVLPHSGRESKSQSKRPNSGQWETEVIPFDRESVTSRQSISSARDAQTKGNKKRRPFSSRPSSTMSGRESRAVAIEGEDLSHYDLLGQDAERDNDDEETLDKLEWELASDTGRLTADGKVSRLSVFEQEEGRSSQSSSRSSNRSLRMSVERDYDISAKLQEDDRLAQRDLEDFNLRRSMTMDEDDVKALG